MQRFNIRVYGLIFNEKQQVLLCDEVHREKHMIKFPGGGLEWGESTVDCLKRELAEEFNLTLLTHEIFYVTDFFQVSFFNSNDQVVSIYYLCKVVGEPISNEKNVDYFWADVATLNLEDVTFPIDRHVLGLLKNRI
jgi:ADP-ribose pyrophosphatase YjhB (NUDIX family)